MRLTSLSFLLLILAALVNRATAQPVTVDVLRSGSPIQTLMFGDGAAIDLTGLSDLNSVTLIRAYSTNSNNLANIGPISLAGTWTNPTPLNVLIGRAGAIDDEAINPLPEAATNFGGVIASGGLVDKVRLSGAILGNVTGDVSVGEVVRLQCGGRLNADLTVTNTGTALGRLVCDASGPGATITADHGRVACL